MPSGRMQVEHVETVITVGTLGAGNAIQVAVLAAGDQGRSLENVYSRLEFEDKTANEGPAYIGYSVGLTDSELAGAYTATPTKYKDPAQSEQANRKVVTIWTANRLSVDSIHAVDDYRLRRCKVPKWDMAEEVAFNAFVFTRSNLTTGMTVRLVQDITYRWLHD